MKINISLPLAADVPVHQDESDSGDPGVRLCHTNLIFADTQHITHINLEETDDDDELAMRFKAAIDNAKKYAPKGAYVGAILSSEDCTTEQYSCGAFEDAVFDYLEKMTILRDCGAELVVVKNNSLLWQMRAAVIAGVQADIPVFVTVNADEDGKSENEVDYIAALITLQSLGASGFGIYSTDGIGELPELLHDILPHAEIPLIAVGGLSSLSIQSLEKLSESGASVFLNTCGSLSEESAKAIMSFKSRFDPDTEKDSYAAAVESEVFFLPENIELSEPIECDYGMSDDMIDMDDENINSICINLNSSDDVSVLAVNSNMSRLPITVHANDTTTLEAALRYFTGRLIVDSRCAIEREELEALCNKYGAIIY